MRGFLFSECFEDLNKKIARRGATLREMVGAATQNPECMPTVSLNFQYITDHYGINEERAKNAFVETSGSGSRDVKRRNRSTNPASKAAI